MGNTVQAVSEAFASDVINEIIDAGGSADAAFGNDAAATFNLGSGLSSWFDSLNAAARNHIVVMGDSNVQPVPDEAYRWPEQLTTDLVTFTGLTYGGPGFRHLGLPEWSRTATGWETTGIGTDFFSTPGPFVNTAADMGPNGYGFVATGTAAIYTWTLPVPFGDHDRFALFAQDDDFLAQQGGYSIDGGAFVATTFNYAPTLGNRWVSQEIATPITTTLRYRGSASNFPVYLNGAAFYDTNGSTGTLVVHNLGKGGNAVTQMSATGASNRLAVLDELQPALTVVWTGTNEFSNIPPTIPQMTLDRFYDHYTEIVSRARVHGDVLMVYPQETNLPNVFSLSPIPKQQTDFERVARKIAYEQDAGYISIHSLWGSWARHNARGYAADDHHLTEAGHNAVSKVLTRAIRRVS